MCINGRNAKEFRSISLSYPLCLRAFVAKDGHKATKTPRKDRQINLKAFAAFRDRNYKKAV